jgi:RNA polymerase sigma-70 factor (ECF subfamily)
MDHASLATTVLRNWVDRIQAGDKSAREELLRRTLLRLEKLAASMLKSYPKVGARVEADDIVQNAALRLLRALETVQPGSVREFYGLAATQIRRELIDLARSFARQPIQPLPSRRSPPADSTVSAWHPEADSTDQFELDKWSRFHQAVETLPDDEREAFSLNYYHGHTQLEIAELCGVTDRTVRRWLQSAMLKLHALLKEEDRR